MEDAGIIELFFERSEQGIRELDIKYGKACRKLSYNIVNDRQDAEECVSDTLLKAWDSIPPQKPKHLFAYLAKICRNDALSKLEQRNAKKRKAEVVSLTEEMECCIPDVSRLRELEARELGRALDDFVRTLSEDNQLIFLRRYWYMDSVGEVAARVGLSEGAVLMRLNRIKGKLRTYLKKEGMYR